jgi:pyruvate/2-oxoglutarate dehydrogenase complex dihydrolipoamide acyltransferase (E2) component
MTEIRIPKTGDAIEEGTLVEWHAADGAKIAEGDPLYTLETDKTEMEIESPCAGVLARIGEEGEEYPVGELIARIDEQAA